MSPSEPGSGEAKGRPVWDRVCPGLAGSLAPGVSLDEASGDECVPPGVRELVSVPVSAAEVTGTLFAIGLTPAGVSEEAGLSGERLVLAQLLPAWPLPVTVIPVGTVRRWVTGPRLASVVSLGEVPLWGLLFRVGSPGTSTAGEGLTAVSATFDATLGFASSCRVCRTSLVN